MSYIAPGVQRMAYIALGSNLDSRWGDRAHTIEKAMEEMNRFGSVEARSSLYETEPVGFQDQPQFLNAVVALATGLEPEALLQQLLLLEKVFGRVRGSATTKGPRTLDLDLLMVDDLVIKSARLTLPHPALAERRFVLAPLQEIAPDLRLPGQRHTVAELLTLLPDEGENRISAVRRYSRAI